MVKKQQRSGVEPIDEHDQPTEPINFTISPYAPTVTSDDPAPNAPTMPAGRPFSQHQVPPQPPLIGAYPFLPPAPAKKIAEGDDMTSGKAAPHSTAKKRRRFIPALVGTFFVIIQLLLLIRVILHTIGLWDNLSWVSVLYGITSIFIWPIQLLVQQIPLPFALNIEIVTLLTILLYGLFSRILVRCLKLLLRTR